MKTALLQEIESTQWVHQAGDMMPLYAFTLFYALTYLLQNKVDESFGTIYSYHYNGAGEVYFPEIRVKGLGDVYLVKKETIGELHRSWLEKFNEVEKLAREIKNKNISQLSNDELFDFCQKISSIYTQAWADAGFVEVYDSSVDEIIDQLLEKCGQNINETERHILLAPEEMALVQKERLDFLEILYSIKKKSLVGNFRSNLGIAKKVQKHADKYFFIKTSYGSSEELSDDVVFKKLQVEIVNDLTKELDDLKRLDKYYFNLAAEKKKLIESLKLDNEVIEIFNFFSLATTWRDQRKNMHQLGAFTYAKIVKEIFRREKISDELVPYIVLSEIPQDFSTIKKLVPDLEKRAAGYVFRIGDDGKMQWFYSEKAEEIRNKLDKEIDEGINEVCGFAACRGCVSGKVAIIKSTDTMKEFKQGNILVAPMTRVEIMPAVRKASAIITDEGGITCHAAIISRELGIPCIIGTKIATKVLKDGDLVEVNADKGVVRKV